MFEILWVLELLIGAPYWDSRKTVVLNLALLNLAQNVRRFFEHYATFNLLSLTEGTTLVINLVLRRYLFYSRPGEA